MPIESFRTWQGGTERAATHHVMSYRAMGVTSDDSPTGVGVRLQVGSMAQADRELGFGPDILQIYLLGGFRARLGKDSSSSIVWQRPSAKALVKILALEPSHRLHREQLQDILWPDLKPASAAGSLRKAIHLARHALEPELPRRGLSRYLELENDIVSLNPDTTWIDVDHFSRLANKALAGRDVTAFTNAIAMYSGELLPEDRYEDWADERRKTYTGLYIRLLSALSDLHKERGAYEAAVQWLQQVAHLEPTREEAHRGLMVLYTMLNDRQSALRQYKLCCELLLRELDADPTEETVRLYEEILADRSPANGHARPVSAVVDGPVLPTGMRRMPRTPFINRQDVVKGILHDLGQAAVGSSDRHHMVLVTGEPGIGKTRLLAEIGWQASQNGYHVLSGSGDVRMNAASYGPFIELLEGHLSRRPIAEREALAASYPELARYVPSLAISRGAWPGVPDPEVEKPRLFATVVHLLDELAAVQPLLIILDELQTMSSESVQLLHQLLRLGAQRKWLILGAYRREEVAPTSELYQLIAYYTRAGLCRSVGLGPLDRESCDKLVRNLLPGNSPDFRTLKDLYELSVGIPLFVEALAGALRNDSAAHGEECSGDLLSRLSGAALWQIRDLVELYLDRLGDRTSQVLSLVAVCGEEATLDSILCAASLAHSPPLTHEEVLETLDKALSAHILEQVGDRYEFRHPLYRLVSDERVSRPRRGHIHSVLAEAKRDPDRNPDEGPSLASG